MKNYTVAVKITESKSFFKKDIYEAALFDKPNINATGSSYDEVIRKVYEKTLEYFDFLSDQGLDIPEPTEINSVTFKKRDKDVFFHVITIDTSIYAEKTEKINVTIPISLTRKIDDFLKDKVHNSNLFSSRSDYITKSCQRYLPYANYLASLYNNEDLIIAHRYHESNTTRNCLNLLDYLKLPNCQEVILFATYRTPTDGFSRDDGPETNLPLMGAIAKVQLPGLNEIYIIFDGLFLTAQRKPRYNEVKDVLDTALETDKTSFIQLSVPFTSQLDPVEAVKILSEFPRQKLTKETRPTFFNLLSNLTEEQYVIF
ncbi:type II toxin-antitoxin system HicB family antitoxin [Acinetobacter baumannii]|uniref:type II toxin-antitoxin system HicB family antitoxin n=1 Tax=Acinetobacter baumannii TaxID=470 RepID=UPI0018DC972F|nr:type II toxin-antitoxin system HicB family antitoxin [Acinetobacter baumannii]MBH8486000.1 type II toxin-antitoxin system HicB family antitoxin [Acinetobacter baumannii]